LRALDVRFLDVGNVEVLGEFKIAVLAMVDVLRHTPPPSQHDSAEACGRTMKSLWSWELSAVCGVERLEACSAPDNSSTFGASDRLPGVLFAEQAVDGVALVTVNQAGIF
jgi:hypothetical protein